MNFLAHYAVATRMGTPPAPHALYAIANALPDLLPLAAPRTRLRLSLLHNAPAKTPDDRAITHGVWMHLSTDTIFHKTRAFADAEGQVGVLVDSAGFTQMRARRFFLAHVLTELALDASLLRRDLSLVEKFYGDIGGADTGQITLWTEQVTGQNLPRLPETLTRFTRSQYLRHYADDAGVAEGFNRLCARARQDTFAGGNWDRLVHLTGQIVTLMEAGLADSLLAETLAGLR